MAKAAPEMAVVTKVYDLVIWSCQHIAKFPRSQRFTLGDRLEMRLYDVLEKLLRAKYSRDRLPMLREVNMELELLRFQFRIAKDLKCLSLEAIRFTDRTGVSVSPDRGPASVREGPAKSSTRPVRTGRRRPKALTGLS